MLLFKPLVAAALVLGVFLAPVDAQAFGNWGMFGMGGGGNYNNSGCYSSRCDCCDSGYGYGSGYGGRYQGRYYSGR
ncbi:MAG: hypothetical protein Q8K75_11605 [Chlamydiales bacterium]|nr:hypothetical protein [Chlamydiales bacterium]